MFEENKNMEREEKYMSKYKRFISPTLTVLMLTSQLTGCSTTNAAETMNMLKANETIEINIPEPENIEEGKEISYNWIELAYLDSYSELRSTMDDVLYIIKMADNGKNGVIYVTEDGNHSNNTTLQDAFNNKKFINNYWNNKETNQRIIAASKKTFSDVETDREALLAAYSAYYNLLPSYDVNYANMQSTLSRLEAMSLLYRAVNPVDDTLQVSTDFTSKVGDNEHSIFAEQIDNKGLTYLTSKNSSLDESTATGTMTRAEYVFMIVQNFYADEYNTLTKDDIKSFTKSTEFVDLQNAGNVAKEQKYIYTEKNKETGVKEEKAYNRYQSYELNYCLQNVEDGLTENLFKAYIIANNHNILTDTEETGWELGLTKEYALELLTNVLEETGGNVNYDRGESKGEAIINKVEESETATEATVGQGGDKSILNELQQLPEEDKKLDVYQLQAKYGEDYTSPLAAQYYTINEDGSYTFTEDFIAIVQESRFGSGATIEQITDYFNEYDHKLDYLKYGNLDKFIDKLEAMGNRPLAPQQQQQPSTSTNTETANNNTTTTPSTSGNTSSSGDSTSSTNNTGGSTGSSTGSTSSSGGSLPAGWISDDQLPPRDVPKGSTGGALNNTSGNGSGTGPLTSNYDIGNLMQ